MRSEGNLPKSAFSTFLNRYPEALVVKLKLRASVQKQREGDRLMHDFLYRLQKQAHQLKKQGHGGFACPILVSFKKLIFAGIGPDITHPASLCFHHLEGFFPSKKRSVESV
ncbi:hypothetical protein LA983_001026 [Vibrio fluvialis]|nr:hypothetical protein [Vibrio fluvialis]